MTTGNTTASTPPPGFFRHPLANGWSLFWALTLPMTGILVVEMLRHDLTSPEAVSEMIGYSVRWAVPFIYFVVAASAVPVLFPSDFTRWWSRNRKYIGLVFAVAMAWQGAFIFIMSTLHTPYYYEEVYFLRDELEGTSGYVFLAGMVITSFTFGRSLISPKQWKVLHRCGIYFLWAYPFSVYWWNLFYYPDTVPGYQNETYDYIFYVAGFLAFAARIAAWGKRRSLQNAKAGVTDVARSLQGLGVAFIALGIIASVTGDMWFYAINGVLTFPSWSANMELWLPFWPLEPFLPLIAIGLGTWCYTGGFAGEAAAKMPKATPSAA